MAKIALGTWAWGAGAFGGDAVFGSKTDVENLKTVFDAAMKAGLNLWDTATAYGMGESERILGTLARQYERKGVEMTQISLAWLLTKVESPIVGATKLHHIEDAVKSLDVRLTADDIRYLEESYVPHNLSGVMAVNKPAMSEEPVWVKAAKNK